MNKKQHRVKKRNTIQRKMQDGNTVMSDVKAVYSIKYRVYSKEREREKRKRWIPIFMGMTEGGMGMTERDKTGRINPTPTIY